MNNQKKPMERIEEYIENTDDDRADPDKSDSVNSNQAQTLRACVREWLEDYALTCRRISDPGSHNEESGD